MLSRPLQLYAVFHLNLAYSSIEEEQRPEVIRRCYWPLLRLARRLNLPFGIEASGYTLEAAASVDPEWIAELRRICSEGPCEFIGSGYAQLIGPLVPAEVNAANLRIGNLAYQALLGRRPSVALVNEQAFASGLVQHYLDAGYKAILMEWDNPASFHPEWPSEWRYFPQYACGQHGEEIVLIWNNSIAFQKIQRYAHGEMELDEYRNYLCKHVSGIPRTFSLYGNDVEIFDFRPGRYRTEAAMQEDGEWKRIERLFEVLRNDGRFEVIRPSRVMEFLGTPHAGNRLRLESAEQPIPVKKQEKYNITRWAVTGRDDLEINAACFRIYGSLKERREAGDADWRELCYLWSSDFRTHITESRWVEFRKRLAAFEDRIGTGRPFVPPDAGREARTGKRIEGSPHVRIRIEENGGFRNVETASVLARLNCRRGMAIDALWFKGVSDRHLFGTIHHGFYDDIRWGADYYTGHLTMESPGRPKVTDLSPVTPSVVHSDDRVTLKGSVMTPLGAISKEIDLFHDERRVEIEYALDWEAIPLGALRLGYITINPSAFDRDTLFYRTRNGGYGDETFPLRGKTIEHGKAVSFLVSATHGIGATGGVVELGDAARSVRVSVDKSRSALIGFVTYQEIGDTWFFRLCFSAGEIDETSRSTDRSRKGARFRISFTPGDPDGSGSGTAR